MAFKLEDELFRLLVSRYVPFPLDLVDLVDLVDGAGLGGLAFVMLLIVAEAGIRGGGIESCLTRSSFSA
jgi:hypothetical protein